MDKSPEAFRTISEVAEEIDVPQHVLRFWESRFAQIRPMKRAGGRRFYRREDVELLRGVRHLLYGEGYTIRGVQRILRDQGAAFVQNVWRIGAEPSSQSRDDRAGEAIAAPEGTERMEPDLLPTSLASRASQPAGGGSARWRFEPPLASTPPAAQSAARGIAADAKRKLRAALDDLVECHRLLEAALADRDPADSMC